VISTPQQKYSGDHIVKNEMGGACSTYGDTRGVYGVWVRKSKGKRLLERPRCRWEDNTKIDLQKLGCGGIDRIDVVQNMDR
jgi:hypothetical protein